MATGLPIISTKVGGIPEVIEDKKNGLLIEPKNPAILSEKILELINNSELANNLSQKAQEDIAKEFNMEKMLTETSKIYSV